MMKLNFFVNETKKSIQNLFYSSTKAKVNLYKEIESRELYIREFCFVETCGNVKKDKLSYVNTVHYPDCL